MTSDNPNDLRVTVIGCSGTYSSSESACSSYLVQTNTTAVMLDAGPGSSIELQKHLELAAVDAIVLSHEHPDHWTEMPTLYHAYRYGLGDRNVAVFGTAGTKAVLDGACDQATQTVFDWTTIDATSTVQVGDIAFTFSETDHPVETLAIRAESGGSSIVYSADTGPDWSPANFAASIDLMVYEASLRQDQQDSGIPHVTGAQAGQRASDANVGALILTHVPPGESMADRLAATAGVFPRSVNGAVPGIVFRP